MALNKDQWRGFISISGHVRVSTELILKSHSASVAIQVNYVLSVVQICQYFVSIFLEAVYISYATDCAVVVAVFQICIRELHDSNLHCDICYTD